VDDIVFGHDLDGSSEDHSEELWSDFIGAAGMTVSELPHPDLHNS